MNFGRKRPVAQPLRVQLEGAIVRIALLTPNRIVALEQREVFHSRLVCFDFNGKRLWQHDLDDYYLSHLRVANGFVWLGCKDRLRSFDAQGKEHLFVVLPLLSGEEAGCFLIGDNGFFVSFHRTLQEKNADLSPRVIHIDFEGRTQWKTDLEVPNLLFEGVVSASKATSWNLQPSAAWRPSAWKADSYINDPLLLSGEILLASYSDCATTGLGVSYAIDKKTGEFLWTTPVFPFTRRAIYKESEFVLSVGGYGASQTLILSAKGEIAQSWNCNGAFCVDDRQSIWMIGEHTAKQFHLLTSDGAIITGPGVSSFYSTQPLLSDGGLIFWSGGELIRIDARQKKHVLYRDKALEESHVLSRMLISPSGNLIFATAGQHVSSCLWITEGRRECLAHTVWPCGQGNVEGNPIWSEG